MTFAETLLISLIPATISFLVFNQQLTSFRRETMAERAARHFLKHKGYTDRTFETLKKHLGGWDTNEDELRRILVRAGAIRTFRDGKEWWTLLSRWDEKIEKLKNRDN